MSDNDQSRSASFSTPRYYDYDGTPASQQDSDHSPVLYYPEGRTRRIPPSQFDKLAEPLTYAEFEQRLREIKH